MQPLPPRRSLVPRIATGATAVTGATEIAIEMAVGIVIGTGNDEIVAEIKVERRRISTEMRR
jgi:hypothetical protein